MLSDRWNYQRFNTSSPFTFAHWRIFMFRSGLAISGTLLLVLGLGMIGIVRLDTRRALSQDSSDIPRAAAGPPLSLSLEIPRRIMDLHQEQVATVRVENR